MLTALCQLFGTLRHFADETFRHTFERVLPYNPVAAKPRMAGKLRSPDGQVGSTETGIKRRILRNPPPCGRLPGVHCEPPASEAGKLYRDCIVMNVQIAPLQTPPAREDDLDARNRGGHARTLCDRRRCAARWCWAASGISPMTAARPRRNAAPGRAGKGGAGRNRDMAVIEHTIGTVMANSTVQVNARVNGQLTKPSSRKARW